MTLRRSIPFFLSLVVFLFLANIARRSSPSPASFSCPPHTLCHSVRFFEPALFQQSVRQVQNTFRPTYHITGGVIPHHLLASFMIADFYHRLSYQNPQNLILIGPNHFEAGKYKALTSLAHWETPFTLISPGMSVIDPLLQSQLVKVDENTLLQEFSVASHLPFISYYLPRTRVIPLILSSRLTLAEADILAENLKPLITSDTVAIASVDFSHYLKSPEAQENDSLTIAAIKNFRLRELYSLGNDYLDSPPSLVVLLLLMQKLGHTHIDELYHTDSGQLLSSPSHSTTSYFSFAYY